MTVHPAWKLLLVTGLAVALVMLRYRSSWPEIPPAPTPASLADTAEAMTLVEARLRCELYRRAAAEVEAGNLTDGSRLQETLRSGNLDITRRAWLPLDERAEQVIPAEAIDPVERSKVLDYLREVARGFERVSGPSW